MNTYQRNGENKMAARWPMSIRKRKASINIGMKKNQKARGEKKISVKPNIR